MKESFSLVRQIKDSRNLMFLGETGSGKSELAIQTALALAASGQAVHVFDLDQTRPLFRLRDRKKLLENAGITVHAENQRLDEPVIAGGIVRSLKALDEYTILDVGGGEYAARMAGGFSSLYTDSRSMVFYVLNPYRAFSGNILSVRRTMSGILRSTRVGRIHMIANPYLGRNMTADEFADGLEKTRGMTEGYLPVEMVCVPDFLYEEVKSRVGLPVVPVHRNIVYPWEEETTEV